MRHIDDFTHEAFKKSHPHQAYPDIEYAPHVFFCSFVMDNWDGSELLLSETLPGDTLPGTIDTPAQIAHTNLMRQGPYGLPRDCQFIAQKMSAFVSDGIGDRRSEVIDLAFSTLVGFRYNGRSVHSNALIHLLDKADDLNLLMKECCTFEIFVKFTLCQIPSPPNVIELVALKKFVNKRANLKATDSSYRPLICWVYLHGLLYRPFVLENQK